MQTVTDSASTRKRTTFHAQFHGLSGVITKPGDAVLFLEHESGAVVTLTAADEPHVVVLGDVAEAMQQYVADMAADAHGITEPVVVALDTGQVAFAFTVGGAYE